MNMTYKEILPGIKLRVIESSRFKTSCISVQFLSNISEENASEMTIVPRVLRRGTTKHPDMEALAAALDDMYGARVEPVSRKYGDIIMSGFICDFVDLDEKLLPGVVNLLGEILFDPKTENASFVESYVDGERSNLIDEIKSEINNKMSYALRRTIENMFENSPYAVNELGTEQTAEKIDARSLFRYYKKMISESPCEVFFSGNYTYEEVEKEILRMFRLCRRERPGKVSPQKAESAVNIRKTERLEVAQANLIISMRTADEDIYKSKLMTAVLGGGTTSKLFANVREKESLCYSTGAMFDSFMKAIYIYSGIDPKNAEVAEKAMLREFEHMIYGNITDEEIDNAKKGMIDDLLTTEDSLYSMEAFWMRAALLGDERPPLEVAAAIKNIDVESVIDAAKGFVPSVTYLLTGMEGANSERKLLPDA
ncbi:MAG: insulinase family protein [Oscillospiraceae bacterium]|nr:insulinase family protein [Oscillospiraceae bacterium]